jgi:hypothetical protein
MAEDALKIMSVVFEGAGPDGGTDHGHDALILIDLPMGDCPTRDVEPVPARRTSTGDQ